MPPRWFPVPPLSLMCPRCPQRESGLRKNPLALLQAQKRHAKSSQIVVKINAYLISFRVGFHRKSCAWGVFVRMSFFVNLLTVSGSLDPRSARAGAVETLFLNLRIIVKNVISASFFCIFCDIWTSFPSLGTRVKTRAKQNKKYHSIWVPKMVSKK